MSCTFQLCHVSRRTARRGSSCPSLPRLFQMYWLQRHLRKSGGARVKTLSCGRVRITRFCFNNNRARSNKPHTIEVTEDKAQTANENSKTSWEPPGKVL